MNNVTIIGTGPSGLTAAIYAARAGLNPIVYAGLEPGGQLTTTTAVENFPGFEQGVQGPELMSMMTKQAERFGATIIHEEITRVDFSGPILKLWAGDSLIESKTVIISTGAKAKTLGLPNEQELMGRGLSTCATCDGFFYRRKRVIVLGGGDSAMEEASYLANLANEVILIHRRNEFRASEIMVRRVLSNPKIKVLTPLQVKALVSDETGMTGVRVTNLDRDEEAEIRADGVFMAIGHQPNSAIFKQWLNVDDHGYLVVYDGTRTKVPGVFAAGDIADPHFKQAITAAGMGCQAALQAQKYLEEKE